jgi:hypothetical protein
MKCTYTAVSCSSAPPASESKPEGQSVLWLQRVPSRANIVGTGGPPAPPGGSAGRSSPSLLPGRSPQRRRQPTGLAALWLVLAVEANLPVPGIQDSCATGTLRVDRAAAPASSRPPLTDLPQSAATAAADRPRFRGAGVDGADRAGSWSRPATYAALEHYCFGIFNYLSRGRAWQARSLATCQRARSRGPPAS